MKEALPYPPGVIVQITKLSACTSPVAEPSSWEDWIPGSRNNLASLPVNYELRGILMEEVLVGGFLVVFRTHRNGTEVDGLFESTTIVGISRESLVETFNSVYQVRVHGQERKEKGGQNYYG